MIKLDDFVIPRNEKDAIYTVETMPQMALANNASVVLSNREDIHSPDSSPQEARMLDRISSDVRNIISGGHPQEFWSEIAHRTQLVLDGCMQSMRANGAQISLA